MGPVSGRGGTGGTPDAMGSSTVSPLGVPSFLPTQLIGREATLERLRHSIGSSAGEEPRFLLVTGEAGIGKSRLLQEAQKFAQGAGVISLATTCQEPDRSVPYGPWVELLRQFVLHSPRRRIARVLGPSKAAVVRLLPEVADRVWLFQSETPGPVEWTPRAFHDAILRVFVELGREDPLLIILDDLAWSDEASLDLLELVARTASAARLSLIGAARDAHLADRPDVRRRLAGWETDHLLVRLPLDPLPEPAVARLAAEYLGGGPLDPGLRQLLDRRSSGNPFFLQEYLRALYADGAIEWTNRSWRLRPGVGLRVPESVRGTLRNHLDRLDEPTRELLRTAAVFGTDVPFALLERVADLPEDRLIASIEAAIRATMLRERELPDGQLLYSFPHPLIQETLYEEQSEVRRRKAHRRVAEAFVATIPTDSPQLAPALAHHYLRAQAPAEALGFLLTAGESASRLFARAEAVAHFRQAIAILRQMSAPSRLADGLEKLGDQLWFQGDRVEATKVLEEAGALFESAGETRRAANCFRKIARTQTGPIEVAEAALRRAEALLDAERVDLTTLRFHVYRGELLHDEGRVQESVGEFRRAIGLAEQMQAPAERAEALMFLAGALPVESRTEGAALLRQALDLGREHHLDELMSRLYSEYGAYIFLTTGDVATTWAIAELGYAAALKTADAEEQLWWRGAGMPFVFLHTGDFSAAMHRSEEMQEFRQDHGMVAPESLAIRGCLKAIRGERTEAERLFQAWLARRGGDPPWAYEIQIRNRWARLLFDGGERGAARDQLDQARALGVKVGPPASHTLHYAESLELDVRLSAADGDLGRAQQCVALLGDLAARFDGDPVWPLAWRAQGLYLTYTQPVRPEARALLEKARDRFEQLGWLYHVAVSCADLGALLVRTRELDLARASYERAEGLFRLMEAEPDLVRVREEMKPLSVSSSQARTAASLSPDNDRRGPVGPAATGTDGGPG